MFSKQASKHQASSPSKQASTKQASSKQAQEERKFKRERDKHICGKSTPIRERNRERSETTERRRSKHLRSASQSRLQR